METHPGLKELCIPHILGTQAAQNSEAIALVDPGDTPLTYHRLLTRIKSIAATLNAMGIRRNDRVAVVLPAGSEMAVAIVAVTYCATCAPLNPAYRSEEFESYFVDFDIKALIVGGGAESPARAIAPQFSRYSPSCDGLPALAISVQAQSSDRTSPTHQPHHAVLVPHSWGSGMLAPCLRDRTRSTRRVRCGCHRACTGLEWREYLLQAGGKGPNAAR